MLAICGRSAIGHTEDVMREDFFVKTADGYDIAVRAVAAAPGASRPPVILVHGARVPGIGSFDLPVPGGSLAADLARAGHAVYVMDARGYGRSTRPAAMDVPAAGQAPLVRAWAVMRDIDAVVATVRQRAGVSMVALLGWATGAMWCGMYAALNPDRVGHLVYYNGLYGGSAQHAMLGLGTSNEDTAHPGRFNRAGAGAWRLSTGPDLLRAWDAVIPVEDKSQWRDARVAEAYVKEALASDTTAASRNPASFRAPSGAMEDSFYQATGRQLFDAASIAARVLVLRSARDFWSRPQDAETLARHLDRAAAVQVRTIPDATHHVHLDRPERGRDVFLQSVVGFLAEGY
ncbi:alpha/beta hydrolase [Reyranella sp. CPCC 100927]|nr:alpha/beta hydrolase [Reyranella sp. CPCC 100927]